MGGRTLIVGASQAGLQLAVSLRELGHDGPVTLIGEEEHPPYQRPPLSKTFLTGDQDAESLALRAPGFYLDAGIDLLCGERVTQVALSSSDPPGSGTATTSAGHTLSFDRLALTVGAGPARLALPGAELDGICYLREIGDARRLRARLEAARDVVIVGGGFIGLETAAAARALGKEVTVVEAANRLISRAVAPVVSEFYRRAHTGRGSTVLVSTGVAGFQGRNGRISHVELQDGRQVPADLVLVGIGAVPRTELAEQLGLHCDGGIVVDGYARTSEPSVVAAGDCTVLPNPLTGTGRIRLESVQNAVAQARVAAASLLGRYDDRTVVPWFWSDQGDLKLQIAGLSAGYDECVVRGEPDSERFSVLYYRDGKLLAIDAVNRPADYMAVRKALSVGTTIPAGAAADEAVPLKSLIVNVPSGLVG
jgi:3-phenylpropionate/trans-cinnamate dioxygenase ferredoxin reductase subunit